MKKKYKIYPKTLGKGAFSEVRLAENRESGEKVAIKIIAKKNVSENFKKKSGSRDKDFETSRSSQHYLFKGYV